MAKATKIGAIDISKVIHLNPQLAIKQKAKQSIKASRQKAHIKAVLTNFCKYNFTELIEEHKFDPVRKWRFDYAIPEINTAIEYNGLMSAKSRHTTVTGYTGDMEKLNAAQVQGWKVLQYTALNYKEIESDLQKIKESVKNFGV